MQSGIMRWVGEPSAQSALRRSVVMLLALLLVAGFLLAAPPVGAAGDKEINPPPSPEPSVSPDFVEDTLAPGDSIMVTKTITLPQGYGMSVSATQDCDPLEVQFSDIPAIDESDTTSFDETILVPNDTEPGTYSCSVGFSTDQLEEFVTQDIVITVASVVCDLQACDFGDEGWEGTIVCAKGCAVTVNPLLDPKPLADLTIVPNDDSSFMLTLTSERRDRRWWKDAGVFKYVGDVEEKVDSCTWWETRLWLRRGVEPSTCSIILPVWRGGLMYILFWDTDPSFRFR